MSAVNVQDLEKNMVPVFESLVHSLFDEDYQAFLKHHPPAPEDEFNKAVSILKPLGKPIKLEYLCHLIKENGVKAVCKVSYGDSPEELLWDFNLIPEGDHLTVRNMGFDK